VRPVAPLSEDERHAARFARFDVERQVQGAARIEPGSGAPGEPLSQEAYDKHLKEVMPTEEDVQFVINLEKEPGWIIDPQQGAAPAR